MFCGIKKKIELDPNRTFHFDDGGEVKAIKSVKFPVTIGGVKSVG